MQTISLGTWQFEYNEAGNEIRLFINCFDSDAVMFVLNAKNITSVLETLDKPETHRMTLVGQKMVPQTWMAFLSDLNDWESELDGEGDDQGKFNYSLNQDDLSAYCEGPRRAFVLQFEDDSERRGLASTLWDYWAVDHLLLEAGNA